MTREAAYVALFGLLQTLKGAGKFATVDRRLRTLDDMQVPELPALFMTVGNQTRRVRAGLPPRRTLGADIYVYAASPDAKLASATILNPLLDLVENALEPQGVFQPQQTLGGLVAHAWIEGTILTFEAIKTARAAALIPVTILLP
jgi:hypothetical protein